MQNTKKKDKWRINTNSVASMSEDEKKEIEPIVPE